MNRSFLKSYQGALVADAIAMPVHWYYDVEKMDRDYGRINAYREPLSPHTDSILWRSKYQARNQRGEILHDQAIFWGRKGVHYHQFLPAGGSTLNFQLSAELLCFTLSNQRFDSEAWLQHYVGCMQQAGWHKDTYVEEWHRAFFDNYARRVPLLECGVRDLHVGGLSSVPALLCALTLVEPALSDAELIERVVEHLRRTYRHAKVLSAADSLCRILLDLQRGSSLREAIAAHAQQWCSIGQLETWSRFDDRTVVGKHLSRACYLPDAYTASLYLAFKYSVDFPAGILANAYCGAIAAIGGAVVGSILAVESGVDAHWLDGLSNPTAVASIERCEQYLADKRQLCEC